MHSPTRRAGIWCASCCPCCVPVVASTVPAPGKQLQAPLVSGDGVIAPEARGAALAPTGARGGGFNKPFGRRYDKYLGR